MWSDDLPNHAAPYRTEANLARPLTKKVEFAQMGADASTQEGRRYADKTPRQRRADRRARLLSAGLELFGVEGFRGVTIEALCAAASVSTRNFYEEFGSREALLIALHDEVNGSALRAVAAAIADVDGNDIAGRVRAGVGAYFGVMTSDRRWARIALVESVGVSAQAEEHRRAAVDSFVALIDSEARRLGAAGLIEQRDWHLTAVALAGALNGLVNTWSANADWSAIVPRIVDEAAGLITLALTGTPCPPVRA